jgi:hypothetical protein
MEFQVVPVDTSFLLCLDDMDKMGIRFDNLRNMMVKGSLTVPVVRKWGHPWLQLGKVESIATYLTEPELRCRHRRFGHPSVARLYKILRTVGHDVESKTLKALTKVCHQCQMNGARPTRFKFILHEELSSTMKSSWISSTWKASRSYTSLTPPPPSRLPASYHGYRQHT